MSRTKPILVLCANPALDEEWQVDGVRPEEKNHVLRQRRWAGGKGVNVARWLEYLGCPARLIVLAGGEPGTTLVRLLRKEGLRFRCIPVRGATRINVLMTDLQGRQWRFNQDGPRLSAEEWRGAEQQVLEELERSALLVLSGSLPPGVPPSGYGPLIRQARQAGVRVLLDCDGPALARAVPFGPFLVKPNEAELAAWAGAALRGVKEVAQAAERMSELTGGWVLVSRGGRPGFLVHANQRVRLTLSPPAVRPRNRLGAGDALLAGVGWAILRGLPPEGWLRTGLAMGALATQCPAGQLPLRRCLPALTRARAGSSRD